MLINFVRTRFIQGDMEMPIIRKVIDIGHSKGITIPKSWFEYFRKETGVEVTEVTMEVNRILKVSPVLPKKQERVSER